MMSTPAGRSLPIALVVEDEALLRILAVEVVEEAGFTAIEARDADEAVVLLESRTDITLLSRTSTCPAVWTGSNWPMRCATAGPRSRSWLCRATNDFNPPICRRTVALSKSLTKRRRWSMNFDRCSVPVNREPRNPTPVNERFCSDSPAEECDNVGPDPTRSHRQACCPDYAGSRTGTTSSHAEGTNRP